MVGTAGSAQEVLPLTLNKVSVGGLYLAHVEAMAGWTRDNLLGLNFLNRPGTVTFDNELHDVFEGPSIRFPF